MLPRSSKPILSNHPHQLSRVHGLPVSGSFSIGTIEWESFEMLRRRFFAEADSLNFLDRP
jgi:hypothetical protein